MMSSDGLLITSLQPSIVLHDLEATLNEYWNLLEENDLKNLNPDIICFPEYWNGLRGQAVKEEDLSKSIDFLTIISQKFDAYVVGGSIVTPKDDKLYNQSTVINSKGAVVGQYSKHQLFGYEKTQKFSRGENQLIWSIKGFRTTIRICSDLWSTKLTQVLIDSEIDLLFVPALTVVPERSFTSYGRYLWHSLALIRAKECAVATIVSDTAEGTLKSPFWTTGSSIIVDPSQKFTNSETIGNNMTIKLDSGRRGLLSKEIKLKDIRTQKAYRKDVGLLP